MKKLSKLRSDLVYACQIDDKDAYICTFINKQQKQSKKQLPLVINLCLYSSKQTPYPYSVDIYVCFEDPILAKVATFKPLGLIYLGKAEKKNWLNMELLTC